MSADRFVEDHRYEMKLEEASGLLRAEPQELVSFKIRPITTLGDGFDDAGVLPPVYEQIRRSLPDAFKETNRGYVSRGAATLYSVDDNVEILFVEHETGPEIIFWIGLIKDTAIAAGAAAVAGQQIVKLINLICQIISRENDPERRKGGWFISRAKAIRLERRLVTGGKIIKQFETMADDTSEAIQKWQELIGRE